MNKKVFYFGDGRNVSLTPILGASEASHRVGELFRTKCFKGLRGLFLVTLASAATLIPWNNASTLDANDAPYNVYQQKKGAFAIKKSKVAPLEISATTTLRSLQDEIGKRIHGTTLSASEYAEFVNNEQNYMELMRYAFCKRLDDATFRLIQSKEGGIAFLDYLLNEPSLLQKIMLSGDLVNPNRTLEILYLISKYDSSQEWKTSDLYESMMAACALSAHKENFEIYQFYKIYKDLHKRGWLHRSFERCATRDMRHILNPKLGDWRSIKYMIEHHNVKGDRSGELCWKPRYSRFNEFNDIIHGSGFYMPWNHIYTGSELTHKCGGVCGSLSYYGATCARAHGLPGIPGGQPGHCAYMVRHPATVWTRHFSGEGGPTGNHAPLFGMGTFIELFLVEEMYSDMQAHAQSMGFVWLAESLQDALYPPINVAWKTADIYYLTSVNADFKPSENTPSRTIQNPKLDVSITNRNDHYYIVWKGDFELRKKESLKFSFANDDMGRLILDGKELNAHGRYVPREKAFKATLDLEPGVHTLEIHNGQINGGRFVYFEMQRSSVTLSPNIDACYQNAIAAQPVNYPVYLAYGDYLQSLNNMTLSRWEAYADKVASNLKHYQEAAWRLMYKYVVPPIKKDLGVRGVLDLFKREQPKMIGANPLCGEKLVFDLKVLGPQYNELGKDNELMFELYQLIFPLQTWDNYTFNRTMMWGSDIFMKDKKFAPRYVDCLSNYFSTHSMDGSNMGSFMDKAILSAEANEDLPTFKSLCELNARLNKPKLDKIEPKFKSRLVSDRGMLRTSSSAFDEPMQHCYVLQEVKQGRFHTESEDNPWAKVILWGKCEIDGIYLQNTAGQNAHRSVPVRVSVSEDGTTWKTVFETKEVKNEYKIALDKPVTARYVKVERPAGIKKEFFHYPKILIYGTPLY